MSGPIELQSDENERVLIYLVLTTRGFTINIYQKVVTGLVKQ